MQILDKFIKDIPEIAVDEVLVGAFSTLVKAGNAQGIASTLKGSSPHEHIEGSGNFRSLSLHELAKFIYSEYTLKASIGMAAINAWMSVYERPYQKLKAQNLIYEKGNGKTVGVIGHFPFLENLEGVGKLFIFEKSPIDGDLTEEDIKTYMPEADVAVITGTSLINHTFGEIMQYVRDDAYKIVMGPSTPLSPALFEYGIDAVCGTMVKDYELLKRCVMEAVPVKHLQGKEFVTWLADDNANAGEQKKKSYSNNMTR
ncbi:MAG: Rossmann-like domain-containing protein [Bacteroidota bacterium]